MYLELADGMGKIKYLLWPVFIVSTLVFLIVRCDCLGSLL